MDKLLIKIIKQCNEEFLEENNLDEIDVCILDNFTDYVCNRLDRFFYNIAQVEGK